MTLTKEQIRVIRENPQLRAVTLAKFMGCSYDCVKNYKVRHKLIANRDYNGFGILKVSTF